MAHTQGKVQWSDPYDRPLQPQGLESLPEDTKTEAPPPSHVHARAARSVPLQRSSSLPLTSLTRFRSAHKQYNTAQKYLHVGTDADVSLSWNERIQQALDLPQVTEDQAMAKWSRLTQLNQDFVALCKQYGRVIISELCLAGGNPHHQGLSIPPKTAAIGGRAGGEKYIVNSIIFKLASDPIFGSRHLYSGTAEPNLEFASKALGNELRAARHCFAHAHGAVALSVAERPSGTDNLNSTTTSTNVPAGSHTAPSTTAAPSSTSSAPSSQTSASVSSPLPAPPLASHMFSSPRHADMSSARSGSNASRSASWHDATVPASQISSASALRRSASSLHQLRVPAMVAIDFMGFRLLAEPLLPLDERKGAKLVYGSRDGGVTVHADDPVFNANVQQLANKLHLKKHIVKDKELHLAGDVEGHLGADGRLYLLDFGRVFPPIAPGVKCLLKPHPRAVFYNQLRPELCYILRAQGITPPLNSDAFTKWGLHSGALNPSHDRESCASCRTFHDDMCAVEDATKYLLEVIIPATGKQLDAKVRGYSAEQLAEFSLVSETHKNGINVRYHGILYKHVRSASSIATVILVDIVSRTLKNLLRAWLRSVAERVRGSDFTFKVATQRFLNLVTHSTHVQDKATEFWALQLIPAIRVRFGDFLEIPRRPADLPESPRQDDDDDDGGGGGVEWTDEDNEDNEAEEQETREQESLEDAVMKAAGLSRTQVASSGGGGAKASKGTRRRRRPRPQWHNQEQARKLFVRVQTWLLHIVEYVLDAVGLRLSNACQREARRRRSLVGFTFSHADIVDGEVRVKDAFAISAIEGHLYRQQARQTLQALLPYLSPTDHFPAADASGPALPTDTPVLHRAVTPLYLSGQAKNAQPAPETLKDPRHEHPLQLQGHAYNGLGFICDCCEKADLSHRPRYFCAQCHFDLHPQCVLRREVPIRDAQHPHTLRLLDHVYDGGFSCDGCQEDGHGLVLHCATCRFDLHPECFKPLSDAAKFPGVARLLHLSAARFTQAQSSDPGNLWYQYESAVSQAEAWQREHKWTKSDELVLKLLERCTRRLEKEWKALRAKEKAATKVGSRSETTSPRKSTSAEVAAGLHQSFVAWAGDDDDDVGVAQAVDSEDDELSDKEENEEDVEEVVADEQSTGNSSLTSELGAPNDLPPVGSVGGYGYSYMPLMPTSDALEKANSGATEHAIGSNSCSGDSSSSNSNGNNTSATTTKNNKNHGNGTATNNNTNTNVSVGASSPPVAQSPSRSSTSSKPDFPRHSSSSSWYASQDSSFGEYGVVLHRAQTSASDVSTSTATASPDAAMEAYDAVLDQTTVVAPSLAPTSSSQYSPVLASSRPPALRPSSPTPSSFTTTSFPTPRGSVVDSPTKAQRGIQRERAAWQRTWGIVDGLLAFVVESWGRRAGLSSLSANAPCYGASSPKALERLGTVLELLSAIPLPASHSDRLQSYKAFLARARKQRNQLAVSLYWNYLYRVHNLCVKRLQLYKVHAPHFIPLMRVVIRLLRRGPRALVETEHASRVAAELSANRQYAGPSFRTEESKGAGAVIVPLESKSPELTTTSAKLPLSSLKDSRGSPGGTGTSSGSDIKTSSKVRVVLASPASYLWSAFLDCLSARDHGEAALLLECGLDLNFADDKGQTVLMRWLRHLHKRRRKWGDNAVYTRIQSSVRDICQAGALVDSVDNDGETALHHACRMEDNDMIKCLVDMGADVNLRSSTGKSPLMIVCSRGCDAASRVGLLHLLVAGAHTDKADKNGLTCLMHAAKVARKCDVISTLLHFSSNPNRADPSGQTALFFAVHQGYAYAAWYLLYYGADPNHRDNHKSTALHHAATSMCVQVLLREGARWTLRDADGLSPMQAAITNQRSTVAHFLALSGAYDSDEVDSELNTLLHLALRLKYGRLVRALLDPPEPASGSAEDKFRNVGWQRWLSQQLRAFNQYGLYPIHIAAAFGNDDMVSMLLEYAGHLIGTPHEVRDMVNMPTWWERDPRGATPLMLAVVQSQTQVVRLLASRGADINAADQFGRTAYIYAQLVSSEPSGGSAMMQSLLKLKGATVLSLKPAHRRHPHSAVYPPHALREQRYARGGSSFSHSHASAAPTQSTGTRPAQPSLDSFILSTPRRITLAMMWVLLSKREAVAALLRAGGFDINSTDYDVKVLEQSVMDLPRFPKVQSKEWTMLHVAASSSLSVTKCLVEFGCDLSREDKDGVTPLHLAKDGAIVRALLSAMTASSTSSSASIANTPTRAGHTPLHTAASRGSAALSTITALLEVNADPLRLASDGSSVLHAACGSAANYPNGVPNTHSVVAVLLRARAKPGVRRRWDHKTALHLAVESEDERAVAELLQAKADATVASVAGATPISLAVQLNSATGERILALLDPESSKPN